MICGSLEAAKSWCCCSSITVTASLYLIKTFALYALKHTLQMMPSGPTQKKLWVLGPIFLLLQQFFDTLVETGTKAQKN